MIKQHAWERLRGIFRETWVTLVLTSAIYDLSFGIWQDYIQQEVTNMHYTILICPRCLFEKQMQIPWPCTLSFLPTGSPPDPPIDSSLCLTYCVTRSRLLRFALADRLSYRWSCAFEVRRGSCAEQVLLRTRSIGWGSLLHLSSPFTGTLVMFLLRPGTLAGHNKILPSMDRLWLRTLGTVHWATKWP